MRAATVAPAALLAGALALVSARASAEGERSSSLSWLRMPSADACIATQALARSVEERLGRHVFVSAAEADVSVEGRIERRASGWHAVITIRDSKGALLGTRDLDRHEATCEAMNDPLALVIAVMIDPEAKLSKTPPPLPPPTLAPVGIDPNLPAELPRPPPESVLTPRPKDPLRVEGGVVGIVSTGLAPVLDPGVSLSGVLFPPGVPLGLRGYTALYLPTQAEQDGARGTFDLLYVGGGLCPALRGKAATGMICVGGQLGVVRSHADTKDRAVEEKTLLLLNGAVEARVTLPIAAPVALTGGATAILPLTRPTFHYRHSDPALGQGELHKVGTLALTADLGIAFFFP